MRFQAGGTLHADAFYIERPADQDLPEALLRGELCHVLTTRQMGKSSLRVRAMAKLEALGVVCAAIDLTAIGTDNAKVDEWYYGLTSEIADQLDLEDPDGFWDEHGRLGPVHCFSRYIEDEVLRQLGRADSDSSAQVVVFIDEIDATLSLPFPRDDFFAAIRALFNRRAERLENHRLTFCLLGVAAPADLIDDPTRTPFNIGRGIRLEDFTRAEMARFEPGLAPLGVDATARIDEIFAWTSGHPYMTQRICEDLVAGERGQGLAAGDGDALWADDGPDAGPGGDAGTVDRVVHARFLASGRTEDANLSDAAKRFELPGAARSGPGGRTRAARVLAMLQLYRRLLPGPAVGEAVIADPGDPVQLGLRLTGMAAERQSPGGPRVLEVRNRIFGTIFDAEWVRRQEAGRRIAAPLALWLENQREDDYALGGQALSAMQEWAEGRGDLTAEEQEFLRACVRVDAARAQEALRRRWQRMVIGVLSGAIVVLLGSLVVVGWQYRRAEGETRRAEAAAEQAMNQAARAAREQQNAERQAGIAEGERQRADRKAEEARAAGEQAQEDARKAREAEKRADESAVQARAAERKARTEATRARVAAADSETRRLASLWQASKATATIRRQLLGIETYRTSRQASAPLTSTGLHALANAVHGVAASTPLAGHTGPVTVARFSPDGSRVVTASKDGTARVWRADGTGQPVVLLGHGSGVNSAAFSPDGSRVVTASKDGTARVWRADGAGQPVVLQGHDKSVVSAAFSPDGSRVVTASYDDTARVWLADGTGQPVVLRGHEGFVFSAGLSPDGGRVVTASYDGTARIWRADGTGQPVVLQGHDSRVMSARFSPDGRRVVTVSKDGTARVWRADGTGQPVVLQGHDSPVLNAAFSPDGSRVVTASKDGTARVWRADGTGQPVVLQGHDSRVVSARFSPDGNRVVTASKDGTARVWRTDGTGQPIVLQDRDSLMWRAGFSPDGSRVVTASADGTARVWRADGAGQPVILRGHDSLMWSARFSPDGSRVVTASSDGTARVWRADGTGQPVVLQGHDTSMVSAGFSPDGSRVVTASEDGTARVWRADGTGQPVVLQGHDSRVWSAGFSPDGSRVVTASADGTARVWRTDGTGQPVVLRGHGESVVSAGFSPDGSRVVTASEDGTARVWPLDPEFLARTACSYTGRNFTRAEWAEIFPGTSYRKTCEQWPEAPEESP